MLRQLLVRELFVFVAACMLALAGGAAPTVSAETTAAREYDIKAVYLYNFLIFVSWPASESDALVVGIVGDDPFGKAFLQVENTTVKGTDKKLLVRRFGGFRNQTDLGACNILFVSRSEKENFGRITGALKGRPVLTVADSPDFLARGGMVNLIVVQDKIRWEINRARVEAAGLRLTSQLLQSAVRVVDRDGAAGEVAP